MFFTHLYFASLFLVGLAYAQHAAVTPEVTGENRPWYFNQFSMGFVNGAVELRSSGIPEDEARSVAKHMVDDGLAPPQYTIMASMAMRWAERGNIPATSLSEVASIFASAYTSLHTLSSYSSYVEYVRQHTSIYDLSRLQQSPMQHAVSPRAGASAGNAEQGRAQRVLESIYDSLYANPVGRAALQTFSRVVDQYERDVGFVALPTQPSRSTLLDFVYNYVV